MNAFEYLKLLAERQVVDQLTRSDFGVSAENGNIVFFMQGLAHDSQNHEDYFYVDWYNVGIIGGAADTGLRLRTPEDVRFILEHLEGNFKIDKSLLGF